MSAVHGVRDVTELDGRTFLSLAWRLPAYQGVMRARAIEAAETSDTPPAAARKPQQEAIPVTRAVVAADPMLAGIFSFGGS
jgi:hypothetical protein